MKRIYLDHGASMPIDERVLEVMNQYMVNDYGNPSSLHSEGRAVKKLVGEARTSIAKLVGAEDPQSIIFTASATEANNIAIRGVANRNKGKGNHVITSAIEHMSVVNPIKDLSKDGFDVTFVPVSPEGLVESARYI